MSKSKTIPGGIKAIQYSIDAATKIGITKLLKAIRSRNSFKSCALGTGGQRGGYFNEYGHYYIEICKKNIQAQLTDIQDGIPPPLLLDHSINDLKQLSGCEL
jgi:hypothetical protein